MFNNNAVIGGQSVPTDNTGYVSEGSFSSEAAQLGFEDSPVTINFGTGGLTTNGHVNVASNGEIEIMTSGYYSVKQRFRVSRSGAAQVSEIFLWAETSIDGGSTWIEIGSSIDVSLDSADQTFTVFDSSQLQLDAGVMLRNRFSRSSTGNNSGDLTPGIPSASLVSAGVPTAPSAQITIYKL